MCDKTIPAEIYEEFLHNIQGTEQGYAQKLLSQIGLLSLKYEVVQTYVRVLTFRDEPEIRKFISGIIRINKNDSCEVILNRSKRLLQEIENKRAEYAMVANVAGGKEPDRKYFNHLIIEVSKYVKFQVDKYKMLLAEFVEILEDMREYAHQMEVKMNKSKKAA